MDTNIKNSLKKSWFIIVLSAAVIFLLIKFNASIAEFIVALFGYISSIVTIHLLKNKRSQLQRESKKDLESTVNKVETAVTAIDKSDKEIDKAVAENSKLPDTPEKSTKKVTSILDKLDDMDESN